MFTLESNIASAIEAMTDAQRQQVPFALSRAMNEAVFETRRYVVETTWPKSVTARNKRFAAAAMRVTKKATKYNLQVEVRDTLGRDAFSRQADGETRRPVSGRNLAVPKIKRLSGGSITARMRPRAILAQPNYFKNRKGTAILQRLRNGKLKVVYILIPSAAVRKRFNAYDAAEQTFTRVMPNLFAKHVTLAMEGSLNRLTMRPVR